MSDTAGLLRELTEAVRRYRGDMDASSDACPLPPATLLDRLLVLKQKALSCLELTELALEEEPGDKSKCLLAVSETQAVIRTVQDEITKLRAKMFEAGSEKHV